MTYRPVFDRRRISLLMAVHQNGSAAKTMLDVSFKGSSVASFVEGLPFSPGSVLLLDNASIHKTLSVRQAALRRGYQLLYLPTYSPEFNPIELIFGIAKQHFYKARYDDFRRDWSLDSAVRESIEFGATPSNIRNCFRHTHDVVVSAL